MVSALGRESIIPQVEGLLSEKTRIASLTLREIFPPTEEEESRGRFSLIPPDLFQRLILHLQSKTTVGPVLPSYLYLLMTDEQIRGLNISLLTPAALAELFMTGLKNQEENRRRFALLKAEVVFKAFLDKKFPSGEENFAKFCDLITDEQFERCPLSQFTRDHVEKLFVRSGLSPERCLLHRVNSQEVLEFYTRNAKWTDQGRELAFIKALSAAQKEVLASAVRAKALTKERCFPTTALDYT